MNGGKEICRIGLALSAAVVALAVLPAMAQTPTPTPTPTPSATLGGGFGKPGKASDDSPTTQHEGGKKVRKAGTPIVISNANLAGYAQQSPANIVGKKTQPKPTPKHSPIGGSAEQEKTPSSMESKKEYWQQRYQENVREIKRLEESVATLETAFNKAATDELATRYPDRYDQGAIAWSKECRRRYEAAKAALDTDRKQLADAKQERQTILTDGRRDGALPGWFR